MAGRDGAFSRTFALLGPRAVGKTSLGDRLLDLAGVTRQFGRVDEGTSLLDHDAESRRRRMTLSTSTAWLEWHEHTLFFVDPPGSDGLAYEQRLAAACVDGAILLFDGQQSVGVPVRRLVRETEGIPRFAVLTRLDRTEDPDRVAASAQDAVGNSRALLLHLVAREAGQNIGIIDILRQKMTTSDGERPVRESDRARLALARERLLETVAATDDALLERYLEDLDLEPDQVANALAKAVLSGRLVPILWASAWTGIGGSAILDAVVDWFPSPFDRRRPWALDIEGNDREIAPDGPFVAQHLATQLDEAGERVYLFRVWAGSPPSKGPWVHAETGRSVRPQKFYSLRGGRSATARQAGPGSLIATWDPMESFPGETWTDGPRWVLGGPAAPAPMVAWALETQPAVDAEKMRRSLQIFQTLDPALDRYVDELTLRPVLAGSGLDQLERAVGWLATSLGVQIRYQFPHVSYREAPSLAVHGVEGVHRKTSDGLVSEFGKVILDVEPEGEGFRFEDRSVDEELPEKFMPGVVEGIYRGGEHGPLAGYPVTGLLVRCTGGDYDMLESTSEHFALAAEKALKEALKQSQARFWEPWGRLEIWVPAEHVGPVMSDLAQRRSRITGLEIGQPEAVIFADVPVRETLSFGPRLLAITSGQGRFLQRPGRYEPLPAALAKEVRAASPFLDRTDGG